MSQGTVRVSSCRPALAPRTHAGEPPESDDRGHGRGTASTAMAWRAVRRPSPPRRPRRRMHRGCRPASNGGSPCDCASTTGRRRRSAQTAPISRSSGVCLLAPDEHGGVDGAAVDRTLLRRATPRHRWVCRGECEQRTTSWPASASWVRRRRPRQDHHRPGDSHGSTPAVALARGRGRTLQASGPWSLPRRSPRTRSWSGAERAVTSSSERRRKHRRPLLRERTAIEVGRLQGPLGGECGRATRTARRGTSPSPARRRDGREMGRRHADARSCVLVHDRAVVEDVEQLVVVGGGADLGDEDLHLHRLHLVVKI